MAGHNGACSSGGRLQASSARELANLDIRELATGCVLQLVELVEYKRGTPSANNVSGTFPEYERVIRKPQLLRSLQQRPPSYTAAKSTAVADQTARKHGQSPLEWRRRQRQRWRRRDALLVALPLDRAPVRLHEYGGQLGFVHLR